MSMLAEPRRKQKWSVDPRNSTWSKDDSKFGQKMLERMGWSKGKGLGRSEQGSTEHIKVKIKNNNHGLGANASHEDNWIAHQDDFNELLAQLNSHHGQTPSSEAPSEEKKGFSLEEKSKTSRKRVHYMKFTKGKDLSSRSETDLNCIFGKRSRLEKDQEQESSSSASQSEMEENGTSSAVELDTESITKTVTSTLTMQEYFAQRMAQLKKNRGNQSAALSADSAATEELTAGQICYATEEPKKKKKKKKKNKELVEEVVDEESNSSVVIKDKDNQDNLEKKGLRKKKKDNLNDTNEKVSADVELNLEHLSSSKKKKSKKNKQEEPIKGCDSRESVEITQTKEQDSLVIESDAAQVEKKSKKKKRKMKSQD